MCSVLGRLQDLKRLQQIVREKFVERVAHCQDDVLMKLDVRALPSLFDLALESLAIAICSTMYGRAHLSR
jgi:hypothetical protein